MTSHDVYLPLFNPITSSMVLILDTDIQIYELLFLLSTVFRDQLIVLEGTL